MAVAAGVPGADLIPDDVRALPRLHVDAEGGPRPGADREPRDARLRRPRAAATSTAAPHMHLSHLTEDLEAWYLNFDFDERVLTAFRPGMTSVHQGRRRFAQGPKQVVVGGAARAPVPQDGPLRAQRLDPGDVAPARRTPSAPTARSYPKGTAIPQRADFNTLDNPFAWTADPKRDGMQQGAGRGRALRRLQPVERRLRAQPARDGRRAPRTARSSRCRRATARRASTPCSRRRTARTSSCPPRRHRSFPLAEL